MNSKTNKKYSICSSNSIKPLAEKVIVEEEQNSRQRLINKISLWKEKWLLNQPECLKKIENATDNEFIEKLILSYINYMTAGFNRLLGYVPNVESEDKMSYTELSKFYILLKNAPNCNKLINLYYDKKINKQEKEKKPIKKIIEEEVNIGKKIKKNLKTVAEEINIGKKIKIVAEETKYKKPKNVTKTIIETTKKPSIPTVATITNISTINNFDKEIEKSRGTRNNNPFGDRKLTPSKAPYEDYLGNISKRLNSLENKIDIIKTQKTPNNNNTFENMKYLQKENDIKNKIEEEKKLYKKADNAVFSGKSRNDKQYTIDNEHKNFVYKNPTKFNHNEPSKKIASAYGWSFVPPQFWSVPQKRPPVCIPQKGESCDVKPILDKGVPVDALDYTKVGSILPKFEYKEVYNPNYYYPGWKSQNKPNYPNNGNKFSNKYYNYNIAEKTS